MIDIKKFYFEEALYSKTEISETDLKDIFDLIYFSGKVDTYCPFCKAESLFQAEPIRAKKKNPDINSYNNEIYKIEDFEKDYGFSYFRNNDFKIKFKCLREEYLHSVYFYVRIENDGIFKIGQNPSVADLTNSFVTKKYKNILKLNTITEFNKAIGLYSHGIGIGSFVYLRRIFENLIFETEEQVKTDNDSWDEEKFRNSKMNEKIHLLKNHLPSFLVENKEIYGILSKGIHELDENTCKKIFPIVKAGIEFILDEKLAEKEKAKKKKETAKLLTDIIKEIK